MAKTLADIDLLSLSLQDSLRSLVHSSLQSFQQMVEDACKPTAGLAPDFLWEESLTYAGFKSVAMCTITVLK